MLMRNVSERCSVTGQVFHFHVLKRRPLQQKEFMMLAYDLLIYCFKINHASNVAYHMERSVFERHFDGSEAA